MGSEGEQIIFGEGIDYRPDGQRHAVALTESVNRAAAFGYAVCGTPVRLWPDVILDPSDPNVHEACRAVVKE